MHFHILVHVHAKFDQNPMSGLDATVVNGRTDGRTRDKTSVTFPKCSQFGTGNTKTQHKTKTLTKQTNQNKMAGHSDVFPVKSNNTICEHYLLDILRFMQLEE